jgi:hypothetical protein
VPSRPLRVRCYNTAHPCRFFEGRTPPFRLIVQRAATRFGSSKIGKVSRPTRGAPSDRRLWLCRKIPAECLVLTLLFRALSKLRFANGFDLAAPPFTHIGFAGCVRWTCEQVAMRKEPLRAIAPCFLQLCHMTLFAGLPANSGNARASIMNRI